MLTYKSPGLRENDNFGLELFFPKITFCSSLTRFSCSLRIRWRSSSIKRCSSIMAKRSSALKRKGKSYYMRLGLVTAGWNLPICVELLQFFDYFQPISLRVLLSFSFPLPINYGKGFCINLKFFGSSENIKMIFLKKK